MPNNKLGLECKRINELQHLYNNTMKQTTRMSKLEEQGLMLGELEQNNKEGGISLKLMH